RFRILPLRAFVTFSFFPQTECSQARGLDADRKLFSLVFLHRQRRISRALLLCSRSGSLLGILQSCYHRYLLNAANPLRVRHFGKKEPRGWRTRHGAPNHKLCQYIRGQSAMAVLAAAYAARRFSAADLPVRRSATTSKVTFCPSLRVLMPARSTALI